MEFGQPISIGNRLSVTGAEGDKVGAVAQIVNDGGASRFEATSSFT